MQKEYSYWLIPASLTSNQHKLNMALGMLHPAEPQSHMRDPRIYVVGSCYCESVTMAK